MSKNFSRNKNEWIIFCIFVALFVVFSFTSKSFFTLTNVMNLFSQMTMLGLITLGMAGSLISGGMDLSLGAICSLCTVLTATFVGTYGMNSVLSIVIVFIAAVLCGAFNGVLIGYFKINSMLVTLGTQSLFTGIGLVVSRGITVSIPTDKFALFGRYQIGGVVPFQILVFFAAIALAILLFNYRILGRRVYLIGSNPEVARFAGISIPKGILITYVFSAVMGFLAALVMTSRVSSGRADIAASQLLKAVSASVFGGVSTLGGVGTMVGAMLGVAVITLISNGMDMMNLSTYIQQISIGAMLLIVLAFRHARRK